MRPALERLTQTGAVFTDGTSEPFDAIIAATGFATGLASLIDEPDVLDDLAEPRGISGEPTMHPACISWGSRIACAGIFSRRIARLAAWRGIFSDISLPPVNDAGRSTVDPLKCLEPDAKVDFLLR